MTPLREILYSPQAIEDIQYWAENDPIGFKKIERLIESIAVAPDQGIGKPEPLRFEFSGSWSRRINRQDRIVYSWDADTIYIETARGHYLN